MKRRRSGSGVAALAFGLAANARGASPADAEQASRATRAEARAFVVRAEAHMTTSPRGATVGSMSGAVRVFGAYRFQNQLALSLAAGGVGTRLDIEGRRARSGVYPGNALLGASVRHELNAAAVFSGGLRLGIPLALYPGGIDANRLAELAYVVASSAEGFRDPFMWQANVVPLILDGSGHWQLDETWALKASASPAYLASVNQRPSRFAAALSVDVIARVSRYEPQLGLSYFVSELPLENEQLDQWALRLGTGIWLGQQCWTIELAVGLDAPYGISQNAPHPWWGLGIAGRAGWGAAR